MEDFLPHALLAPPGKAPINAMPITKAGRQLPPRDAGTKAIQHRFDEKAVVLGRHAHMAALTGQAQLLQPLPLIVT